MPLSVVVLVLVPVLGVSSGLLFKRKPSKPLSCGTVTGFQLKPGGVVSVVVLVFDCGG